jgi:Ca2+/Na+ antiporter
MMIKEIIYISLIRASGQSGVGYGVLGSAFVQLTITCGLQHIFPEIFGFKAFGQHGQCFEVVFDLLGVVGITISVDALLLDLTLRGVGFLLFVVLVVKNRRESESTGGRAEVEATSA